MEFNECLSHPSKTNGSEVLNRGRWEGKKFSCQKLILSLKSIFFYFTCQVFRRQMKSTLQNNHENVPKVRLIFYLLNPKLYWHVQQHTIKVHMGIEAFKCHFSITSFFLNCQTSELQYNIVLLYLRHWKHLHNLGYMKLFHWIQLGLDIRRGASDCTR